ncbi:hypothetical protein Slu03_22810 [Sediminihabitans luteus]|nr:hypothetical protein Slu03_22810 [Sediminihabitans luteus]
MCGASGGVFGASRVKVHREGGDYDQETVPGSTSRAAAAADRPAGLYPTCSTELPRTGRRDHDD